MALKARGTENGCARYGRCCKPLACSWSPRCSHDERSFFALDFGCCTPTDFRQPPARTGSQEQVAGPRPPDAKNGRLGLSDARKKRQVRPSTNHPADEASLDCGPSPSVRSPTIYALWCWRVAEGSHRIVGGSGSRVPSARVPRSAAQAPTRRSVVSADQAAPQDLRHAGIVAPRLPDGGARLWRRLIAIGIAYFSSSRGSRAIPRSSSRRSRTCGQPASWVRRPRILFA